MKGKLLLLGSLSLLLICALFVFNRSKDAGAIHREIESNIEKLIQRQYQDLVDFEEELGVYSNPFGISDNGLFTKRVFLNGGLIYWNNDDYTPSYSYLKKPDSVYSVKDSWGIKLVQRRQVWAENDLIEIYSIETISSTPRIINQYLEPSLNDQVFGEYAVTFINSGNWEVKYADSLLFKCNIDSQSTSLHEVGAIFSFILLCLFLLIGFSINQKNSRSWKYYVSLISGLLAMRVFVSFYLNEFVKNLPLFNPVHFSMGWIANSLGELLMNGLVLMGLSLVLHRWVTYTLVQKDKLSTSWNYPIVILTLLFQLALAYSIYLSVWVLLENSQFSLDISESISFDLFRMVSFAYLLSVGFLAFILFNCSQRILRKVNLKNIQLVVIAGVFIALTVVLFQEDVSITFLSLSISFWLAYWFGLDQSLARLKYESFLYVVMVFACISFIVAFSIYRHSEKDDLVSKQKFANRLLISNDILGEYYLSDITKEISSDLYIRTRLLNKVLARQNIRDKIQRQFLSSYFKKYDIDVYLYGADGQALGVDNSVPTLSDWKSEFALPENATNYEGIYFIQERDENARNKYVCFVDIGAYGRQVGSIVLELTLKKYIPKSVFPELLLESKYLLGSKKEFDYAVYSNGELVYKQGRHDFEKMITNVDLVRPELLVGGFEKAESHYFGLLTDEDRLIVIVSPTYDTQKLLANMAFMFLLMVFLSGFLFLISRLFVSTKTITLSTKIQIYLGLSFLVPMIIVSIALINTLNTSYKEEIDRSFSKRSYNVAETLIEHTEAFFSNEINVDEYANEIAKAAALVQGDINIYNAEGQLVTSSQPEIFKLGLLSQLVDPQAFYTISQQMTQNVITDKRIGTLDFKSSYVALRSYKNGKLLGILSTPYFDSKNHLRRQQVEVFNNLIVIFSFIFLISLIGGNYIVMGLVSPLKKIGARIRSMSLQEQNEPIAYEANDEIGSLVSEYNAMLIKLEQSKEALAKSQKESAWKEIARQVAHEIKNPLTPMRLKIQQMMRSFERETKPYETCLLLINQVDSLSSIADSFSEFAKMPAPQNERVEVKDLLDRTINLYQTRDVTITKKYEVDSINVYIDPKIFSRVLTNLILNAIQASEGRDQKISVGIKKQASKVLISVTDTGVGIPESQQEKIFTPYFSTKTKGSGIGLAVAKKGIENAGGNLWFESKEEKGTTFFIALPIYEV
ncbi:MAG: HAMP domain-containing histidine kinase [Cyclobacteriaceae bacterium]